MRWGCHACEDILSKCRYDCLRMAAAIDGSLYDLGANVETGIISVPVADGSITASPSIDT